MPNDGNRTVTLVFKCLRFVFVFDVSTSKRHYEFYIERVILLLKRISISVVASSKVFEHTVHNH